MCNIQNQRFFTVRSLTAQQSSDVKIIIVSVFGVCLDTCLWDTALRRCSAGEKCDTDECQKRLSTSVSPKKKVVHYPFESTRFTCANNGRFYVHLTAGHVSHVRPFPFAISQRGDFVWSPVVVPLIKSKNLGQIFGRLLCPTNRLTDPVVVDQLSVLSLVETDLGFIIWVPYSKFTLIGCQKIK